VKPFILGLRHERAPHGLRDRVTAPVGVVRSGARRNVHLRGLHGRSRLLKEYLLAGIVRLEPLDLGHESANSRRRARKSTGHRLR